MCNVKILFAPVNLYSSKKLWYSPVYYNYTEKSIIVSESTVHGNGKLKERKSNYVTLFPFPNMAKKREHLHKFINIKANVL